MAAAYRAPGQIITSLLDTDWYKLTMMQGVHHKYPNASVAWEFRCRNAENLAPYLGEIRDQIDRLASLALSRDESTYLSGFPYLSPDFIRFLELYRFRPEYVATYMEGSELCIVIDGPWSHSILFEIVILAIISEVRNRVLHPGASIDQVVSRLRDKLAALRRDYTPAQLADFDLYFAKLFDGLRHDSGDPLVFAEKCIRHYERLGIDPRGKTLIFSDALTFDSAMAIKQALEGRIRTSFGIGTSLTCDLPGVTPMNTVIKMVSCNGQPVAKISDAPGKATTRDPEYVHYLRSVFHVDAPA